MIRIICLVATVLMSIAAIIISYKSIKINNEIRAEMERRKRNTRKNLEETFGVKLEGENDA